MSSITFYIGANKYQEKFIKLDCKIIADIVHEKFPFKNFPNSLVKSKPDP